MNVFFAFLASKQENSYEYLFIIFTLYTQYKLRIRRAYKNVCQTIKNTVTHRHNFIIHGVVVVVQTLIPLPLLSPLPLIPPLLGLVVRRQLLACWFLLRDGFGVFLIVRQRCALHDVVPSLGIVAFHDQYNVETVSVGGVVHWNSPIKTPKRYVK